METSSMIIYLISVVIGWIAFYYTVKAAVKWGTIEAKEVLSLKDIKEIHARHKDVPETPARRELQNRYDTGKITFDEYKTQWDKLSS